MRANHDGCKTRTAALSCRTRKRAFHFYSPGIVRRSHDAVRHVHVRARGPVAIGYENEKKALVDRKSDNNKNPNNNKKQRLWPLGNRFRVESQNDQGQICLNHIPVASHSVTGVSPPLSAHDAAAAANGWYSQRATASPTQVSSSV